MTFPVALEIDYPDRELDRLSTLWRVFSFIPAGIILALLSGPIRLGNPGHGVEHGATVVLGSGGVLFLPTALMLVFRQKYPRWWLDFGLELARFSARVSAYIFLLTDRYPTLAQG